MTIRITKLLYAIGAAGNGKFEAASDTVERTITHT